jgi:hypothetical protein
MAVIMRGCDTLTLLTTEPVWPTEKDDGTILVGVRIAVDDATTAVGQVERFVESWYSDYTSKPTDLPPLLGPPHVESRDGGAIEVVVNAPAERFDRVVSLGVALRRAPIEGLDVQGFNDRVSGRSRGYPTVPDEVLRKYWPGAGA